MAPRLRSQAGLVAVGALGADSDCRRALDAKAPGGADVTSRLAWVRLVLAGVAADAHALASLRLHCAGGALLVSKSSGAAK